VHKKAKFRNLASDWENFRRIRNEIIDMIREAKKQYIIKLQNSLWLCLQDGKKDHHLP
jgi:hypothetical protein